VVGGGGGGVVCGVPVLSVGVLPVEGVPLLFGVVDEPLFGVVVEFPLPEVDESVPEVVLVLWLDGEVDEPELVFWVFDWSRQPTMPTAKVTAVAARRAFGNDVFIGLNRWVERGAGQAAGDQAHCGQSTRSGSRSLSERFLSGGSGKGAPGAPEA
jgi:hypothetical protein